VESKLVSRMHRRSRDCLWWIRWLGAEFLKNRCRTSGKRTPALDKTLGSGGPWMDKWNQRGGQAALGGRRRAQRRCDTVQTVRPAQSNPVTLSLYNSKTAPAQSKPLIMGWVHKPVEPVLTRRCTGLESSRPLLGTLDPTFLQSEFPCFYAFYTLLEYLLFLRVVDFFILFFLRITPLNNVAWLYP
jgi:hypothetical protein